MPVPTLPKTHPTSSHAKWIWALFFWTLASLPSVSSALPPTKEGIQKTKAPPPSEGFDRLLTLGLGVHSGYFRAGSSKSADQDSRLVYGFNVHLRLLRALGVSASFDLSNSHGVQGDVYLPYPRLRLTGHLYLTSQKGPVSLNLLGGIGLNTTTSENGGHVLSAYLLGAQLGFKFHNNIVLHLGFRFVFPSYEQVLRQRTSQPGPGQPSSPALQPAMGLQDALDIVGKILDFRTFQLTASLRVYL